MRYDPALHTAQEIIFHLTNFVETKCKDSRGTAWYYDGDLHIEYIFATHWLCEAYELPLSTAQLIIDAEILAGKLRIRKTSRPPTLLHSSNYIVISKNKLNLRA